MKKIYFAILVMLLSSCQETLELYVGLPMQPKNESAVFEPGLNVFGILKSGPTLDTLNHYFEIQQILELSDTISPMMIEGANVQLECATALPAQYNLYEYANGLYSDSTMQFKPGEHWDFTCTIDTNRVTSSTTIPNVPVVLTSSIQQNEGNITFAIEPDNSAYLYDVYFVSDKSVAYKRILPENGAETKVELLVENAAGATFKYLYVFAYDKNYENYVATSNIFFKPNAYRPKFTTVDGGYGCFCSVSSCVILL
jgi:hypothetical protein